MRPARGGTRRQAGVALSTTAPLPAGRATRAGVARSSLAGLLREAVRLDRTQSDPLVSLRNAVGVVAPLVIGALAGNAAFGLGATVGALQTVFADRPGPYRLRALRMSAVALAAAITSGLAVVASRSDLGSALLLLVLAFGAGVLLTAGPSAAQFGTAATAAALVLGHNPQPPSAALHVGLFVLAGGAGVTVLAIAAWPLGRHRPERTALAVLYRELAAAARVHPGSVEGPPATDTLTTTRRALYGLGHDHGPSAEAYRVLLDEAERIRRETVVVTAAAERLAADRNPILAGLARGALTAAASVCDEIADALEHGRSVHDDVLAAARTNVEYAVRRLTDSTDPQAERTRRATAARLQTLSGQLRAAVESTRVGAVEGRQDETRDARGAPPLRDAAAVVRANLTPSAAVLRHAVRLALVVAATDYVVRLLGIDRGYWVALTVLVVLRPDFGATLQRSVLRTVGTIIGLLAASELVHWVPGGDWWHIVLIAGFAFGMRLAGPGNVGLSAVSLSALVVVLLSVQGVGAHQTLVDRSLSTLVGGALAVLASLTLPAWERRFVPGRLADLLLAYREYLDAIADPSANRDRLQRARAASRRARTNAQASVDRAQAEPVRGQAEVELGRTVLTHSHRLIHALLALDAVRGAVQGALDTARQPSTLSAFLGMAGEVLDVLADAILAERAPVGVATLRPDQEALAETLRTDPDVVGGLETATTLVQATDRITNSLDTLAVELRRQLGPGRAAGAAVTVAE